MTFRIKGLWEKRLCEGTSGNVLKHEINKHTKINLPNCSAVQCYPENLQRFSLSSSDNVLVSIHGCDKYSGKQESQGINVWCSLGFQDSLQAIILGMSGQEVCDTKVIDKKSKEREGRYMYIYVFAYWLFSEAFSFLAVFRTPCQENVAFNYRLGLLKSNSNHDNSPQTCSEANLLKTFQAFSPGIPDCVD